MIHVRISISLVPSVPLPGLVYPFYFDSIELKRDHYYFKLQEYIMESLGRCCCLVSSFHKLCPTYYFAYEDRLDGAPGRRHGLFYMCSARKQYQYI